jgi:DNA-binding NarL/FixJ family response regulator
MTDSVVSTLTIALISSHHVVRLGLQKIFETRATPRFLIHPYQRMTPDVLLPENRSDVIILDMDTERDVTSAVKQMRDAALKSKILLLSGLDDKERMYEAVECGVDGLILKIQPPTVILAVIDALYPPPPNAGNGMKFVDLQVVSKPLQLSEIQPAMWPDALTEREREVIGLVRQGLSNKDIAYRLSISDSTVRHHLTSIFGKVGVPNRQKLLVHAHNVRSTPG